MAGGGDLSFLVEKYPYRKQTWLQRLSLHLDEWSIPKTEMWLRKWSFGYLARSLWMFLLRVISFWEGGVGRNFLKDYVILYCQAKGDTGLTSMCRPDVISLECFLEWLWEKKHFENNKPVGTKEKITSSERGLNIKIRKRQWVRENAHDH